MLGFGTNKKISKFCNNIISNMGDAVIVMDGDSKMIFCNEGVQRAFGYYHDELIGASVSKLIPSGLNCRRDELMAMFDEESIPSHIMSSNDDSNEEEEQIQGMKKDGNMFSVSVEIMDVSLGSNKYYAAIVRDISENKSKEEELLKLASTDPLTGAFNRREFKSLAEQEGLRSQRYNRPLSIMMLDLDHFKNLNDTYGHAAGDKALQNFTESCSEALRNMDLFGRWGGEEFVVLLPETDKPGAIIIADRLRKVVEEASFMHGSNKIMFTVSIGVAQYRTDETTVDAPLARADVAIYDAKKLGRNQVVAAED